MAAAGVGACFNHLARESSDIDRLAQFYQELFGLERIESPKFECKVIWLRKSSFCLHLIERDPQTCLPEGPWSAKHDSLADPSKLFRGHHICFDVPNFDSFLQTLKEKGIETHGRTQPNGKTRQVFFFDPDGNGLEVNSRDS